jgi:hypothetical protein
MVIFPPAATMWNPFGVVRGAAQRPTTSAVSARRRRSKISTSSFQSASSWTRPCCMSTPQ